MSDAGPSHFLDQFDDHVVIKKVGVLAHSYGRSLNFTNQIITCGPSGVDRYVVQVFSAPGATTDNIASTQAYHNLKKYNPNIVCLIVGGNDIKNTNTDAKQIALNLEKLTKDLENEICCKVIIFGVEVRTRPRGVSATEFKRIKHRIDNYLKLKWKYTKVRFVPIGVRDTDLGRDGVHLSAQGSDSLQERIIEAIRNMSDKIRAGEI